MKNLFDKGRPASCIAAGSFFMAAMMSAPHALAHDATAERIRQLEQSLQAIQIELQRIKSESSQAAQKVNHIRTNN